jgi:hypothetical protein
MTGFFTRAAALSLAATLWLAAPVCAATLITYCGQSLHGRGYLAADLDCTGFNGHAVMITRGRLDLNGFTIRGANYAGVHCKGPCRIYGPGTVTENGLNGVHAEDWAIIRGATITNNLVSGVYARNLNGGSRVLIKSATITGNSFHGVETDNAAVIRYSTISNNGSNGIDVGVQDCESGGRALIYRSTATGNGATCINTPVCADISACGRTYPSPRLRLSTCGTSYVRGSGAPGTSWNVCAGD